MAKIGQKITFFVQNVGSRSIICANYLLNQLGNISSICTSPYNSFIPIGIIFKVRRSNFRAKIGQNLPKNHFFLYKMAIISTNNILNRLGKCFPYPRFTLQYFHTNWHFIWGQEKKFSGQNWPKLARKLHFSVQNGGSRSIICANYLLNRLGRYFQYLCFTVH